MKTAIEIRGLLHDFDAEASNYPGMTYEKGIEEALLWVLGEIEDDEFTPIADA